MPFGSTKSSALPVLELRWAGTLGFSNGDASAVPHRNVPGSVGPAVSSLPHAPM